MNANQFDIWVAINPAECIAPRSALVSSADQSGDSRLCYFEGNLYDADNMRRFTDRVMHAAGRAVTRYPTVAKSRIPVTDLRHVGTYDARSRRICSITDHDALLSYLSPEPLPVVLTAEEARRRASAALSGFMAVPHHSSGGHDVWGRLHTWTGATRRNAGVALFECVTLDGEATEWLPAMGFPFPSVDSGLRWLLDQ